MEIKVNQGILSSNERTALENKKVFDENGLFVINIMGSPGAGKTTVLEKTIDILVNSVKLGVIEGDIYTSKDAQRIEKHGVPVKQINTGGACHLDAGMVSKVLTDFRLSEIELLVIENVGNLVCPVEFNLGEDIKIAVLSITEGDDKPMKYPLIFRESRAVILNKVDLIDFTDVDMNSLRTDIKRINPKIEIFEVSARTGQGINEWSRWLLEKVKDKNVKNAVN
ncbi:MAG: hydrogenase nickel incorporation protein HypB [Eubacteriales bacterium]|nr:hydrogenase nickel incorporation protein HypB [Bacillota bacterium]